MLLKVWAVFLVITAAVWFIEAGRILTGFVPTKLSMFVAFIITAFTVAKWAYEAWTGNITK